MFPLFGTLSFPVTVGNVLEPVRHAAPHITRLGWMNYLAEYKNGRQQCLVVYSAALCAASLVLALDVAFHGHGVRKGTYPWFRS